MCSCPECSAGYFELGFFAAAFLSGALALPVATAAPPLADAATFFAWPRAPAAAAAAGTPPSFTSCRVRRAFRRAALLRWRMPLDAARSSARMASRAVAERADCASGPPLSERRALTIFVLTSDRTARLRSVRRTLARACFLADAVRLATFRFQVGEEHEVRIIEASGVRAQREAPFSASRRLHRADCSPHR